MGVVDGDLEVPRRVERVRPLQDEELDEDVDGEHREADPAVERPLAPVCSCSTSRFLCDLDTGLILRRVPVFVGKPFRPGYKRAWQARTLLGRAAALPKTFTSEARRTQAVRESRCQLRWHGDSQAAVCSADGPRGS